LLRLADGSLDRTALLEALAEGLAAQTGMKLPDGSVVASLAQARAFLGTSLDRTLAKLARMGLLTI
jgi:hypothetical protein